MLVALPRAGSYDFRVGIFNTFSPPSPITMSFYQPKRQKRMEDMARHKCVFENSHTNMDLMIGRISSVFPQIRKKGLIDAIVQHCMSCQLLPIVTTNIFLRIHGFDFRTAQISFIPKQIEYVRDFATSASTK